MVTNLPPLFFAQSDETIQLLETIEKSKYSSKTGSLKIRDEFDYVLDAAGDFKALIVPTRCC